MAIDESKLQDELRRQFFSDGEELILSLETKSSEYRTSPKSSLQELLRAAHNLKGSAQLSVFKECGC